MLDLAGATRGADDGSSRLLTEAWGGAAVQQLGSEAELMAWETRSLPRSPRLVVKVVYDRSAGELRVFGRGPGGTFTNRFPAEPDLESAIAKAKAYLEVRPGVPEH
jgi:hypothetical protein